MARKALLLATSRGEIMEQQAAPSASKQKTGSAVNFCRLANNLAAMPAGSPAPSTDSSQATAATDPVLPTPAEPPPTQRPRKHRVRHADQQPTNQEQQHQQTAVTSTAPAAAAAAPGDEIQPAASTPPPERPAPLLQPLPANAAAASDHHLAVTIHRTSALHKLPHSLLPRASPAAVTAAAAGRPPPPVQQLRIRCFLADTGLLPPAVVAVPAPETTAAATKPTAAAAPAASAARRKPPPPHWNETLVFPSPALAPPPPPHGRLVHQHVLLFVLEVDEAPIAWAFFKPVTVHGDSNADAEARLQFFHLPRAGLRNNNRRLDALSCLIFMREGGKQCFVVSPSHPPHTTTRSRQRRATRWGARPPPQPASNNNADPSQDGPQPPSSPAFEQAAVLDWFQDTRLRGTPFPASLFITVRSIPKAMAAEVLTTLRSNAAWHAPLLANQSPLPAQARASSPGAAPAPASAPQQLRHQLDIRRQLSVQPVWQRLRSQTCRLPNRLHKRLWAGDKGCFSLAFSHRGTLLAAACADRDLNVINLYTVAGAGSPPTETGHLLVAFNGHHNLVHDLAWSQDDKLLASASSDGTICVWDTQLFSPAPLQVGWGDSFVWWVFIIHSLTQLVVSFKTHRCYATPALYSA